MLFLILFLHKCHIYQHFVRQCSLAIYPNRHLRVPPRALSKPASATVPAAQQQDRKILWYFLGFKVDPLGQALLRCPDLKATLVSIIRAPAQMVIT